MRAENNKSTSRPNYIDAITGKPVMSKEDARIVLSVLHQIPSEKIDMELVNICLAVINDGPVIDDRVNVRRAVKVFKKRIAQRKAEEQATGRTSRRLSKRMAVALVVIGCLLLAAVCYALGWLPWLYAFSEDKDNYYVDIVGNAEMEAQPFSEFFPTGLNEEFDQLLRDNRLYVPLPTWIPERFDKAAVQLDELAGSVQVFAAFSNDEMPDQGLSIDVAKYYLDSDIVSDFLYPKDGKVFEEYASGERRYTIYSNRDRICALLFDQPYTNTIIGTVSLEEMYQILNSIDRKGLH